MTTMLPDQPPTQPEVYQGQFGMFEITAADRRGVQVYRAALGMAALSFIAGVAIALTQSSSVWALSTLTVLYALFWLGLGISLATIHIYLAPLHRLLQGLWLIGGIASCVIAFSSSMPLAVTVYQYPLTLFGVGFTFAALTGIFLKEAFCFNRLEAKVLTPLVPLLLLGHLSGSLPIAVEKSLLIVWAALFAIFVLRKAVQPLAPDIGDKSVFEYLKAKRQQTA